MNVALWGRTVTPGVGLHRSRRDEGVGHEKYKAMSEKKGPTSMTQGLTTFIGIRTSCAF
jgi:hypothetical protein